MNQKKAADDEIARLRLLLSNTVAQRGKNYINLRGFTIRFQNDDSSASRGAKHFQDIIRLLNFPPADEILIEKSDKHPSWTLRSYFESLIKDIEMQNEYTLIIGRFSGHDQLDIHDRLIFHDADSGRQELHHLTSTELYDELNDTKTDVVMIFDSYYSGLAVRGVEAETINRSVDIISAVDSVQKALGNFKDAMKMKVLHLPVGYLRK